MFVLRHLILNSCTHITFNIAIIVDTTMAIISILIIDDYVIDISQIDWRLSLMPIFFILAID